MISEEVSYVTCSMDEGYHAACPETECAALSSLSGGEVNVYTQGL